MPLEVERIRVNSEYISLSFPVIYLPDRRNQRVGRMVRWVCQRHLEILLFHRDDGGSTGAIWKILTETNLSRTSLCITKKLVTDGVINQEEFNQVLQEYKSALPAEICDPCSLGRIRVCTLIPIATAAAVCRKFGLSPTSIEFLRAFSQEVPRTWEQREEQATLAANLQCDLSLDEMLEESSLEAEDVTFRDELTNMPLFSTVKEDDERLKTYSLKRPSSQLKRELARFIENRTCTFSAKRQGGAVQSISATADETQLLRFFGYLDLNNKLPVGAFLHLDVMLRADLGDLVQGYAQWLENTQRCRFSTIANYLNGLVSITSYAYANLSPADAVFNSDPNPLSQLINLRGQAEKASKTQQMFEPTRVGGWIEWPDVQKARLTGMKKLETATTGNTPAQALKSLQRDACALSLLSLIPPDRVGCIRKLRLGHTLKKKDDGSWKIDLSKQRDGHKTSRFYGPFAATLPAALTPILDIYTKNFSLEPEGESAYLFHPPTSNFDRAMESSAWTGWVKRLFKRHAGVEVSPKTLRSSFITWLRNNTTAPEILKSAAHCMKHSEQRQASADYDQEADDRLVKAAYDFNLEFATAFVESEAPSQPNEDEDDEDHEVHEDRGWKTFDLGGVPLFATLHGKALKRGQARTFLVDLPITPQCPLNPFCDVLFILEGADKGIVVDLPPRWLSTATKLTLTIKVDRKLTDNESIQVIQVLYRDKNDDDDDEEEEEVDEADEVDEVDEADEVDGGEADNEAFESVEEEEVVEPAWMKEKASNIPTVVDARRKIAAVVAPPPAPPPPAPPPPTPPPPTPSLARRLPRRPLPGAANYITSSGRTSKPRARYGEKGEHDEPSSAFKSSPLKRKKSVDPREEMGVPDWCLPGNEVWATGLHAGTRKRFKARVVKLRNLFPRIVVKFFEDENGETNPLSLPEMQIAYVLILDVSPKDW